MFGKLDLSSPLDLVSRVLSEHSGRPRAGGLLVAAALAGGCNRGPARIEAPDWDPPALAEQIISELDKGGDGQVNQQELSASPGLASGVRYLDRDQNGEVTAAEIEAQFAKYRDRRVGLRAPTFRLTYKGRPVPDAEVTFLPERYLEGVIEPAHGTTDVDGFFAPQTEGQDVPGARLGYYRVQVKSPQVKIPAKYSTEESPLGANISLVEDESSYGVNSVSQLAIPD